MKNGQCPKCGGREISKVPGNRSQVSIPLKALSGGAFLNILTCCLCGYAEWWVEDPADLDRIRKRWPPEPK